MSHALRGPAIAAAAAFLVLPTVGGAQQHVHAAGMSHDSATATAAKPTLAGQYAFATIAEIVRLLEADPRTDWTRVDIEGLRQHLIDMDDVTMRSTVVRTDIPGGARFEVAGEGRVRDAIRRMALAHGATITPAHGFAWTATERPGGAAVTIVAATPSDARIVARLRTLGFIGLLTLGEHHTVHHLAIASGQVPAAHQH